MRAFKLSEVSRLVTWFDIKGSYVNMMPLKDPEIQHIATVKILKSYTIPGVRTIQPVDENFALVMGVHTEARLSMNNYVHIL